jgi:hydrogenase maturation factor
MNLFYGEIVAMFPEDGIVAGKIQVGTVRKKVALDLLVDPRVGDRVLVCDGVAIGKVEAQKVMENDNVSGHPR